MNDFLTRVDMALQKASVNSDDRIEILLQLEKQSEWDQKELALFLESEKFAAASFFDNYRRKKQSIAAGGHGWDQIIAEEEAELEKLAKE